MMYELRIITTMCIGVMILLIALFLKGLTLNKNKASIIGFGFMELVYVLSLICIWV